MSQVFEPYLFTSVLPMNLRVLCSHPVFCSFRVDKISIYIIYVNTDYHKLNFTFLSHFDFALLSKNSEAPAPTLDMARKR